MPEMETALPEPNQDVHKTRHDLRERALNSLFFFCKAVYGMTDLTPELHGDIADFMSIKTRNRKRLRASRAHLKTSVATIGKHGWKSFRFLCGKDDYGDDEFPSAIISSTATNARKMGREFSRRYQSSSVRQWLFPEIEVGPEWSKDARQLINTSNGRSAIVDFFGVGAKASSRHYRLMTLDDIHAIEEATDSPPAVEDVVAWYKHTDSLLIEPKLDGIDVVGTPCSLNPPDVYLYIDKHEPDAYITHDRPCYNPDGQPAWPERFPMHVLESIRRKQGDYLFGLQYLLVYIDPKSIEFHTSDLIPVVVAGDRSDPLYLLEDGRKYYLHQLSTAATVDLAGWKGDGDDNAILVAGMTTDEMEIYLEAWRQRTPPDVLIDKIVDFHKIYHYNVVGVEEVGYQQTLEYYLQKRIVADNLALTVEPLKPGRISKDGRIRTRQPDVRAKKIAVREGLTLFLEELSRFNKGKKHLLDCFAYMPRVLKPPMREEMQELDDEEQQSFVQAMSSSYVG